MLFLCAFLLPFLCSLSFLHAESYPGGELLLGSKNRPGKNACDSKSILLLRSKSWRIILLRSIYSSTASATPIMLLRSSHDASPKDLLAKMQARRLTELCLDAKMATSDDKFFPDLLSALQEGKGRSIRSVYLSLDLFSFTPLPSSLNSGTPPVGKDPALKEQEQDADDLPPSLPPQHKHNSSWLLLLLQTLSRTCPNLHSLRLFSAGTDAHLSVPALAAFVQTCPTLQRLFLKRSLKLNSSLEVQILADALRDHPALQQINMLDLQLAATTGGVVSLDPLMEALCTIPTLETVDLSLSSSSSSSSGGKEQEQSESCSNSTPAFSPHLLTALLDGCPLLTDISLWDCHLQDAHLQALAPALQRHQRLQFLSLRRNGALSEAAWCRFYHELEFCYCLQTLFNDHVEFSHLHHPSVLQHCANGDETARAATAAELYLGLNQLERGDLLSREQQQQGGNKEDEREEWIEFLGSISDSEAALYYMVRSGAPMLASLILLQD